MKAAISKRCLWERLSCSRNVRATCCWDSPNKQNFIHPTWEQNNCSTRLDRMFDAVSNMLQHFEWSSNTVAERWNVGWPNVLDRPTFMVWLGLYASVNSNSTHPPPGHLLTLSVPAVGHLQLYHGSGAGHLGNPRAFDIWLQPKTGGRALKKPKFLNEGKQISNRCISLRRELCIVYFSRDRKQGVFAPQKAENCCFAQKLKNIATGPYREVFSYENQMYTSACGRARVLKLKINCFASLSVTI